MTRRITLCASLAFAALLGLTAIQARADSDDGIVRVKSAVPMQEAITRIKADIAAKGIRFFSEIDQAALAAELLAAAGLSRAAVHQRGQHRAVAGALIEDLGAAPQDAAVPGREAEQDLGAPRAVVAVDAAHQTAAAAGADWKSVPGFGVMAAIRPGPS